MTAPPSDDFDALLRGGPAQQGEAGRGTSRSGILLLVASISAVLVGAAVIASAVLVLGGIGVDGTGADGTAIAEAPPAADAAQEASGTADSGATGGMTAPAGTTGIASLADEEWVAEHAERTGIPLRALSAYAGASIAVARESPGCGLGWNTLAGIGVVESEHGAISGGSINTAGETTIPVIGIALDGTSSQAIHDTDDGALDGDTVWDRAVGPMQFIPQTWEQWGSDGSGDGVADPQNIDDAALSAARYLCASGYDLTDSGGWIAAIASYNDTVDYNNRVASAASRYAEAVS